MKIEGVKGGTIDGERDLIITSDDRGIKIWDSINTKMQNFNIQHAIDRKTTEKTLEKWFDEKGIPKKSQKFNCKWLFLSPAPIVFLHIVLSFFDYLNKLEESE